MITQTCRRGHPRTPETTYSYPRKNGTMRVMCRLCNELKDKTNANSGCRRKNTGTNIFEIGDDDCKIVIADGRYALIDRIDLDKVASAGRWSSAGRYVFCPVQRILLHRFIANPPPGMVVDHINHDTLDCRRSNLRAVTPSQNCQNQQVSGRRNNTSGQKNVSWCTATQTWKVSVHVGGKNHYGGGWIDYEYACQKAQELRKQLHSHCPENSLPVSG